MYSRILAEYIYQIHGVRVVWTPEQPGQEPPF